VRGVGGKEFARPDAGDGRVPASSVAATTSTSRKACWNDQQRRKAPAGWKPFGKGTHRYLLSRAQEYMMDV
jgi:hypothetical protein